MSLYADFKVLSEAHVSFRVNSKVPSGAHVSFRIDFKVHPGAAETNWTRQMELLAGPFDCAYRWLCTVGRRSFLAEPINGA